MSHYDYVLSQEIAAEGYPFYALIMAAMRQASTLNATRLKAAFPAAQEELEKRYNAPGGKLESD